MYDNNLRTVKRATKNVQNDLNNRYHQNRYQAKTLFQSLSLAS